MNLEFQLISWYMNVVLERRSEWITECTAQHVHSAAWGHHNIHSTFLFSFVALTPKLSGVLWPIHGWFLFSISFVRSLWGCYFMFSSGGDCSLLFFQDLLFGNFPIHLVTMEVNVCPVGFSILLLLLSHLCGARSSRRGGEYRGQGKPSPSDSKARPSPPSKALNEEKLQVCRQIPSGNSCIPLSS